MADVIRRKRKNSKHRRFVTEVEDEGFIVLSFAILGLGFMLGYDYTDRQWRFRVALPGAAHRHWRWMK